MKTKLVFSPIQFQNPMVGTFLYAFYIQKGSCPGEMNPMDTERDLRNFLLAILLITLLSLGYMFYLDFFSQSWMQESAGRAPVLADSVPTLPAETVETSSPSSPPSPSSPSGIREATPSSPLIPPEKHSKDSVLLESAHWLLYARVPLSGLPGRVILKNFMAFDSLPVRLNAESEAELLLSGKADGKTWTWSSLSAHFRIIRQQAGFLRLQHVDSLLVVEITYQADSTHPYRILWKFSVRPRTSTSFQILNADLKWRYRYIRQEKHPDLESRYTTLYYQLREDESVSSLSWRKSEEENLSVSVRWFAFKHQFFTFAVISPDGFPYARFTQTIYDETTPDALWLKEAQVSVGIPLQAKEDGSWTHQMLLYAGPNHYRILRQAGYDLEKVLPLGWALFRWITIGVILPVFHFLEEKIPSYGLIILILAILIKVVLLPLTWRSYIAMAKMSALKPLLDELREKYRDNPQKLALEQMNLMRRAGVSPLGGCLPMLLQLPVLIAMYQFFPASIELRGQSFLWIDDLSTYDVIATLPFSIPLYGSHVSLLALLLGISMLGMNYMTQQMTPGGAQYRWMSYVMTVFLVLLFNSFPAALNLYYLYFNLLSFGQNLLMRRFVNTEEVRKKVQERARAPSPKSRSFLETRMQQWYELRKKQKEWERRQKRLREQQMFRSGKRRKKPS